MCEVLEVARSGFYAWRKRPESERSKHHRELINEIKAIHADPKLQYYGSPRVHRELVARGYACSENTVAKLMRANGLVAKTRKKYKVTTDSRHGLPTAENLLDREFEQEAPDRVWVGDITYIWTLEGWLYLAAILDTYSRKIVGWSMSQRMEESLVSNALRMALGRRLPNQAESLIHHSDRGSQYASHAFQQLLQEHNITCSMSRKGDCWDNAMMESFFATLKKELIHHEHYATRDAARQSVFEYIELFYNTRRRHSGLGYLSPEEYEQAA